MSYGAGVDNVQYIAERREGDVVIDLKLVEGDSCWVFKRKVMDQSFFAPVFARNRKHGLKSEGFVVDQNVYIRRKNSEPVILDELECLLKVADCCRGF